MEFRKAKPEDAEEIRLVSLECSVSRDEKRHGFVDFLTPTTTEYQDRMKQTPCIYVAINETVVGFVAGYSSNILDKTHKNDDVVKIVRAEKNLIYLEQIAVRVEGRRNGTGQALMYRVLADAKSAGFNKAGTVVVHSPIKNEPSVNLIARNGFHLVNETELIPGLLFGFYQKEL